jgi:alpha 1,2-mannosyltransferase
MNPVVYALKRLQKKRSLLALVSTASALVLLVLFVHQFNNNASGNTVPLSPASITSGKNTGDTPKQETVPFYKTPAAMKMKQAGDDSESQPEGQLTRKEKVRQISLKMETDKSGSRLVQAHKFFNNVFDALLKGEPKVPKLDRYKSDDRIYHAGYDGPSDVVFSEEYLNQFLDLTANEVKSLKHSHSAVVNSLPDYPKNLYNGNGVVYVGGGKFNWLALLSIKSLRSLNCRLPVEVLIPTEDEYEIELCSKILPALNAKCILLPHALGEEAYAKYTFKGYQYKALALIVSSFENVLLLDSDNIPVHSPDYLFDSEPFKSTGLVTWPDFWRRATSPNYYKIAGIEVTNERVHFGYDDREKECTENCDNIDPVKDIPFHDRKGAIPDSSSESGQLMISKSSHTKALFLALYYNLYGPDYYYPLFSQGSDGEGDKETFIAAAVALKSKYYQVKKFLNAFGHFNPENDFIGCGMGQYDPVEDYEYQLGKKTKAAKNLKDPRILFVHANFPKLNPVSLKKEGKLIENYERIRLYGPGMAKRVGYDFELIQWKSMDFLVCELDIVLDAFEGESNQDVCREIKEQLKHLEDTAKDNERD